MEIFEKFEIENIKKNNRICGINYTQKIFAGKWKITIIWFLKNEARRYSEIKKFLSNISQGSLTKQLRELEEDGIVGRKVYPEVPPRVEYFLTEKGKKLIPVLDTMEEFANFYIEEYIKNLNNRESTIKAEIKKRKILEVQIQKIMEFFETNDEELEKLLNIKESRARDLLRYLVKNDMLQKIGATRNIRYIKTVGKKIKQRKSLRNRCLKINNKN